MTNETNNPKINLKALVKSMKHIECFSDNEISKLETWSIYKDLKQSIKQLRKENKKLKQSKIETEDVKNLIDLYCKSESLHIRIQENKLPQPSAIFKCAKTNEPFRRGHYWCISTLNNPGMGSIDAPDYRYITFDITNGGWSSSYKVIAFTETDPQEIINSLNK